MKKVMLDPQEWLRLKAVSQKDKDDAMDITASFVTWYMQRHNLSREYGPLSDEEMDGRASTIIAKQAYAKIFGGEQHWKEGRELSKQMIYTANSIIQHQVRDYFAKGKDLATNMSWLTENQQKKAEHELYRDYNPHLRDFGYDQARNAVRGKPRFLAYVNALYVERCYIGVSKRMKIPIEEVMEIERELLDFLDAV